jgi:nucleoid-associated protein YgaU
LLKKIRQAEVDPHYAPTEKQKFIYERKISAQDRDIKDLQAQLEGQKTNLEGQKANLKEQLAEDKGIIEEKEKRIMEQDEMIKELAVKFAQLQINDTDRLNITAENLLANLSTALSVSSIREAERYTVKRGDYLAQIARNHYNGNALYWLLIYAANPTRIPSRDPNKITPGTTLIIPKIPPSLMEYAPLQTAVIKQ